MKNLVFTPISQAFILGALPIDKQAAPVAVRQPVHHFYVIDKSGSMYSTLPKLIEDLKMQARRLQTGDALTFGWFSSSGEFGFPIKAFRVVGGESFAELDRLFDSHKEAMNMTCFSGALAEVGKILGETAFLNARNCLTFFSDGWANDRSVAEEQRKTREIMTALSGRFDLVLTVAYSDYADRAFLAEMAALAGGETVSAARLADVSDIFSRFLSRAESSEARIKIELGDFKPEFVFGVDTDAATGGVTLYERNAAGEIFYAPNANYPLEFLYFLARNDEAFRMAFDHDGGGGGEFDLQEQLLILKNAFSDDNFNGLLSAAFASAVVLSQNGKQSEAIDVLGYLGDEHLVNRLGAAYAPTERGAVENEIRRAALDPGERWKDGQIFNCTPEPDAFCVINLLNLLSSDASVKFHPRHPAFKYKKIGRASKQREGFPMFVADAGATSPFSEFVWNKEMLNLSVRARIGGTVELPDEIRVDAGGKPSLNGTAILKRPATIAKIFPTFQWRNYAIIKDGFLNVERLPVSCSVETAAELFGREIFTTEQTMPGGVLGVVELSRLPVINKLIAEDAPRAEDLANRVWQDERYSARLKVHKALRDELDPRREIAPKTEWTLDESRFLAAVGIAADGSYSPPCDNAPATDHYEATSFKISISGHSSLPKLSELREKLKADKPLSVPMVTMKIALENFETSTRNFSVKEKVLWLDDQIFDLRRKQATLRHEIQKPKFAMLLGHRWFTDVAPSDGDIVLELTEKVTAKISITKKKISI